MTKISPPNAEDLRRLLAELEALPKLNYPYEYEQNEHRHVRDVNGHIVVETVRVRRRSP